VPGMEERSMIGTEENTVRGTETATITVTVTVVEGIETLGVIGTGEGIQCARVTGKGVRGMRWNGRMGMDGAQVRKSAMANVLAVEAQDHRHQMSEKKTGRGILEQRERQNLMWRSREGQIRKPRLSEPEGSSKREDTPEEGEI